MLFETTDKGLSLIVQDGYSFSVDSVSPDALPAETVLVFDTNQTVFVTCATNHPIWTSLLLLFHAIGPVGAALFSLCVYLLMWMFQSALLVWLAMLVMIVYADDEASSSEKGRLEKGIMLAGRTMFVLGGILLAQGLERS